MLLNTLLTGVLAAISREHFLVQTKAGKHDVKITSGVRGLLSADDLWSPALGQARGAWWSSGHHPFFAN